MLVLKPAAPLIEDFETPKQSKVWPKNQSKVQSKVRVPANQSKAKKALKKTKQSKVHQTKAKQSQHFPLVKAILVANLSASSENANHPKVRFSIHIYAEKLLLL